MKKYLLLFTLIFSLSATGFGQDYETAGGVRGGFYNGLTIKKFISEKSAFEGILTSRWVGFNVTGLYELHSMDAFDVDRLNWYYGIGGHLGYYNGSSYSYWNSSTVTGYAMVLGIDGILGLEYNFEEIPINVSVDWKPAFNLLGYTGFLGDGGALSIRYIF